MIWGWIRNYGKKSNLAPEVTRLFMAFKHHKADGTLLAALLALAAIMAFAPVFGWPARSRGTLASRGRSILSVGLGTWATVRRHVRVEQWGAVLLARVLRQVAAMLVAELQLHRQLGRNSAEYPVPSRAPASSPVC